MSMVLIGWLGALLIFAAAGAGRAAESTSRAAGSAPILLWPNGAPGAMGDGPEDKPRLTPYLLPGHRPRACVIVCPGGGYRFRSDHEGGPVARWLNGLGVASLVLDYRVAPYRHPLPLGDAQRAVRLVRSRAAEWNIDPARVGMLGFSAGGHLAACAGTIFDAGNPGAPDPIDRQGSRPDALILCYPLISLRGHPHRDSLTALLGPEPESEWRESLSLDSRVTPETPPTFLWHTSDDGCVSVENSLWMAAALHRHGVPFALHVFDRGEHGLGLAADHPQARQWTALCAEWLRGIGFAEPSA
jgi:acetyl esterase/lipase